MTMLNGNLLDFERVCEGIEFFVNSIQYIRWIFFRNWKSGIQHADLFITRSIQDQKYGLHQLKTWFWIKTFNMECVYMGGRWLREKCDLEKFEVSSSSHKQTQVPTNKLIQLFGSRSPTETPKLFLNCFCVGAKLL